MIKEIYGKNPTEIREQVNKFLEDIKQDCPVSIQALRPDMVNEGYSWVAYVYYNVFKNVMKMPLGRAWLHQNKEKINISLHNGKKRIPNVKLKDLTLVEGDYVFEEEGKKLKVTKSRDGKSDYIISEL